MEIYLSVAIAKDRETLEKSPRPGYYYKVENELEFKYWLGQTLVDTWNLYKTAEAGVTNENINENKASEIVADVNFGELMQFALNSMAEAENLMLPYKCIRVDVCDKYADLVARIDELKMEFYGGKVRFAHDPELSRQNLIKKATIES